MNKRSKKVRVMVWVVVIILIAAMIIPTAMSAVYAEADTDSNNEAVGVSEISVTAPEPEEVDILGISTAADGNGLKIPNRIYFGDFNVAGMTSEQAHDLVNDYIESLAGENVNLTTGETSITVTADQLGLTWANDEIIDEAISIGQKGNLIRRYKDSRDLEHEDVVYTIGLEVDKEQVADLLEDHLEELNADPENASINHETGEFVIEGGGKGVTVDIQGSVEAINDFFADGWFDNADVSLVADFTEPEVSREVLSQIKDQLGTYRTDFSSSSAGRAQNIKNGSRLINGSLIMPGETYSVTDAVSPFTAENGYELAGSYESGTTVQTYGGGICQVSTTLYNAVIRAELEIVEHHPHSMIVSYVDPSADAAIAENIKDFRFKNNTDYPIYIESYTYDGVIEFTIYGNDTREEGRTVSFESETTSTTEPTTQYVATSDKIGYISQKQSSHVGKTARLWKIIKVDGEEVGREIFNESTYTMSPQIYEVGTSSPSATASQAMYNAISTQNLYNIQSVIAQYQYATADTDNSSSSSDSGSSSSSNSSSDSGSSSNSGSSSSNSGTGDTSDVDTIDEYINPTEGEE